MAANIVLLLDLNCFPIHPESDVTSIKNDVKWMQEYVLTLMSKAASDDGTKDVDFTKILWAYKFFNSSKNTDYRTKNKLESFTISTFEAFEKNTLTEYEKFQSENQDCLNNINQQQSTANKISNLSQALMRIISDFEWTDSSITKNNLDQRNSVYVILRVPKNDTELKAFVGDSDFISSPSSRTLLNILLPVAFQKAFTTKHNIQLNFIDTGIDDLSPIFSFTSPTTKVGGGGNEYSKQIVHILEHLNKGTVIPMLKSQPAPPGLPSYFTLLKNSLKQATASPSSKELSGAQKVLTRITKTFETSRTIESINSPSSHRTSIRHSIVQKQKYHHHQQTQQQLYHHHHQQHYPPPSEASSYRPKLKPKVRGSKVQEKQYHHHPPQQPPPQHHHRRRRNETIESDDSFLLLHNNKNDYDSSMSEELNSCVFDKHEEIKLNKYLQKMSAKQIQQQQQAKRLKKEQRLHKSLRSPKVLVRNDGSVSGSMTSSSVIVHHKSNHNILSNSQQYSRSNAEKTIAKKRQLEKRKWHRTIKKAEEDQRAHCVQRNMVLGKFRLNLENTKTKLNIFLENAHVNETTSMEAMCEEVINFKEKCMADKNQCILALAQAIVHFMLGKLRVHQIIGPNAQDYFEKVFYARVTEIKGLVAESLNNSDPLYVHFRECQLQILYRMETSWLSASRASYEIVLEEIIGFLKIMSAYCQDLRVADFMSDILVHGYLETHAELLVELYRGLHLDPPIHLLANLSPNKGDKTLFGKSPARSSFRSSSIASPFGSSESVFRPPSAVKFGTSKVGVQRFPTQDSFVSNKSSARYTNHVYVNNPKKQILVPAPKAKLTLGKKSAKSPNIGGGQSKGQTKPKSIRRNLFQVDKSSKKDTKSLLSLTSTNRFSRSPSVSSSHKSSRFISQSPRNRTMRSKRRLNLDDDEDVHNNDSYAGSPEMFSSPYNDQIICPGTPSYKPGNSCKKYRRSLSYRSSSEKKIIQESPEVSKEAYPKGYSQLVHSFSFYSTGGDSYKSRAWEKSGNKMRAAKLKRTVDTSSFMNTGLTLSDLEIIGGSSPDCKSDTASSNHHAGSSIQTPKLKNVSSSQSMDAPCCSKTLVGSYLPPPTSSSSCGNNNNDRNEQHIEVVQSNVNPNIEALIRNEFAVSSALLKNTNSATPTKKISFNFDESRIKTPNSRNSPGTPKSILKTPNRNNNNNNVNGTPNESDDINKIVNNDVTPAKNSSLPPNIPLSFEASITTPMTNNTNNNNINDNVQISVEKEITQPTSSTPPPPKSIQALSPDICGYTN